MASTKTQFTVGLFVIAGFAVVAAAVIWLGMSHYLQKGDLYVAYFDESVQGLDKDSPVKYRGVTIGRVQSLGVAPDGKLIQAVIKIESDIEPGENWVAQLTAVGITGLMFIELDRGSDRRATVSPEIDFPSRYPVIPTVPSGIKQFKEGLGELLDQLQGIDFIGIADRIKDAVEGFNSALRGARIEDLSSDMQLAIQSVQALAESPRWEQLLAAAENAASAFAELSKTAEGAVSDVNRSVTAVDRNFAAIKEDFRLAVTDFRTAVAKADRFFEDGERLAEDGGARLARIERQLAVTLRTLRRSSEHLNRLLEEISEQPSRLLFGQPPPPRPLEAPDSP